MAAAPENDSLHDREPDEPLWLGSALRRGEAEMRGDGWTGEEGEAQPRWLGSVARRDGSQTEGAGWVEPERSEARHWLGSVARRGGQLPAVETPETGGDSVRPLYLVDIEPGSESDAKGAEQSEAAGSWQGSSTRARLEEARQTEPETASEPPPSVDELGERREGRYVVGTLGMPLRVVA